MSHVIGMLLTIAFLHQVGGWCRVIDVMLVRHVIGRLLFGSQKHAHIPACHVTSSSAAWRESRYVYPQLHYCGIKNTYISIAIFKYIFIIKGSFVMFYLLMPQVLFIGDSTNRGIMHYLMEQVNGSLTHWDKTHDTQLYSGLNQDQTTVGFAYYPQFWLPAGQRPVFDKALAQLLKQ